MLAFTSTSLWRSETIVMMTWTRSMDVLSTHVLVVHRYYVTMVATSISLLVLIWIVLITLASSIISITVCRSSGLRVRMMLISSDAWQFFRWFMTMSLIWAVHAKSLIHIIHVLWRSKVLKNVLYILVVSRGIWSSTCQCRLIVDTSVGSFNTKVSHVARGNQIETEFTRLYEFHIANPASHLVLAGHDSMWVDAPWVWFPVLVRIHTVVSLCSDSKNLVLAWIFELIPHISHLHVLLHVKTLTLLAAMNVSAR